MYFFFNDTATTEIYTLSLHDALPISFGHHWFLSLMAARSTQDRHYDNTGMEGDHRMFYTTSLISGRNSAKPDRKSTRLNSSHANISYAVFCLKQKQHNF